MRSFSVAALLILVFSALTFTGVQSAVGKKAKGGLVPDLSSGHPAAGWFMLKEEVQERVNAAASSGDKKGQKYWERVANNLVKANEWSRRSDRTRLRKLISVLKVLLKPDSTTTRADREYYFRFLEAVGNTFDRPLWAKDNNGDLLVPRERLLAAGVSEGKLKRYDQLATRAMVSRAWSFDDSADDLVRLAAAKKALDYELRATKIIAKLIRKHLP